MREFGRAITVEKTIKIRKQITDTKYEENTIKSDNVTGTDREKSNIAIAILKQSTIC